MSPKMLRPLSIRDFRLLWVGQTVSLVGDGMLSVALVWQALEISPRPTSIALVLVARMLPRSIMLLVGGAVSDRFSRRKVMLSSDLTQGLALGMIAILAATGDLELWHLAALGAVQGVASAFFLPASSSIIPNVVSEDLLQPANSLLSTSRLFAEQFAGPALGGILVGTVGTGWAFGADALTFGVSVLTLAAMRVRTERTSSHASLRTEIRKGIEYVRRQRWLGVTLVTFALGNFLLSGPISVLVPILVRQELHAGAGALGVVFASFGVGGAIAAITAGLLGRPRRRITAVYASFIMAAIVLATLGLGGGVAVVAGMMGLAGALLTLGNLYWETLVQEMVPRTILGRVMSVDWFMSVSLLPLSVAIVGPIGVALGAPTVFAIGGLVATAAATTAYFIPGVRDPDQAVVVPGRREGAP